MSSDALDKVLQFELERLLLGDRHRLAHDAFAAKLTYDDRIFGAQQFFQQRTFFLSVASDTIDKSFLRAIIQGDVTRRRPTAEHANLSHPFRADAAGRQ